MNNREAIAGALVAALKNIRDPKPPHVTREPFDVTELSAQQLPAIIVRTGDEERSDATQHSGTDIIRRGTITFRLECYVKGFPTDTAINDLIEAIEIAVESDRTMGGRAKRAFVTEISVADEQDDPYAVFFVSVVVDYFYTRSVP